jgi:hypothetical protein
MRVTMALFSMLYCLYFFFTERTRHFFQVKKKNTCSCAGLRALLVEVLREQRDIGGRQIDASIIGIAL